MSDLPFDEVRAALQGEAFAEELALPRLVGKLATGRPVDAAPPSLTFARLVAGDQATTAVAREVELCLEGLAPAARSLAEAMAEAFATSPEDLSAAQAALRSIGALLSSAVGAVVPPSTVLDATVLEAFRAAGARFDGDQMHGKRPLAEELVRRVAARLRVGLVTPVGRELPHDGDRRLRELIGKDEAAAARAKQLAAQIRASLPEP